MVRSRPVIQTALSRDLQDAIDFHKAVLAEGSKALVGYDTAKAVANVVLLSEIPTTYDKRSPSGRSTPATCCCAVCPASARPSSA